MKISQLLQGMIEIPARQDSEVTGVSSDSRGIKAGDCFLALKGENQDGRNYIRDVIAKGASAILVDEGHGYQLDDSSIPIFHVPKLVDKLGEIAARFYQRPSEQVTMVGVTGTNGKTSTSQFIAMAMKMHQISCGVVGTLGFGFPEQLLPTTHTTANALVLQQQLAAMQQQGAKVIAMEVSSHALEQGRTNGVAFDIAIFTNLTRDHLDYHGTMENYANAKRKLFYAPGLKYAVINTDDDFGLALAQELKNKITVYGYGLQVRDASIPTMTAHHIHLNHKGLSAKISSPFGEGQLKSKLLGRFNLSNLLAVLTTLQLLNVPFEASLEYLAALQTVPGRMQVFGGGKLPLVVVDYAHTPDALMQVLIALREHTQGTLWCLFGCGGDRDKGKRPLMGQIAERYSDHLIITDDNPRTEDPINIVSEIVAGLLCPWAVEIEHDRGAAIAHVISCAAAGDVILVAGKGHEPYQIIGQEKIAFSDSEHIQLQLKQKMTVNS